MTRLKQVTAKYTISVATPRHLDFPQMVSFFAWVAREESKLYEFRAENFQIVEYLKRHRMTICWREGIPVGVMLARLVPSIFDPETKLLIQDLLFVKPGTRAAKILLDDFIDFGKANANHILTGIAEKTNIKPKSLEKLGFKKLETLYRMEI